MWLLALFACIGDRPDDSASPVCATAAPGASWQACVHAGEVTGLEFLPDGTGLAHAGEDGAYGIVEASDGTERFAWQHPYTLSDRIGLAMDVSADGGLLAVLNGPGRCPAGDIIVWRDPASGEVVKEEDVLCQGAHAISIGPDAEIVAWAAVGKHLTQYTPPDQLIWTQHDGPPQPTSVWTDDAHVVVFIGHDWGIAAYRGDIAFPMPDAVAQVAEVALDSAASRIAIAGESGLRQGAVQWSGDDVPSVALETDPVSQAAYVAMSGTPDLSRVVAGVVDGTVRVYDLPAGELVTELQLGSALRRVAISPDGTRVAAGAADGSIAVWGVGS